jgi:hypothetical protein
MSAVAGPRFFVPGESSGRRAEQRYEELRARAGVGAAHRRIFSVACRLEGRDCVIQVGTPSPLDGRDVLAIFDLGSTNGYAIATDSSMPALQLGRHVYAVTEFA